MPQSKIVIVPVVVIAGVLLTLLLVDVRQPIPSEKDLPNEVIIGRANQLEEAKIFLTKYPDANIEVDRSGQLAVDYRFTKPAQAGNSDVQPYLRLRILMNPAGEPQELFTECWDGRNRHIEKNDIINYLRTETCLEQ